MLDIAVDANGGIVFVASLGILFASSFVVFSCLKCRRFLERRRQKKQNKREEKIDVPEIKINIAQPQQEKTENGVSNPVYQEAEEGKTEEDPQVETEVEEGEKSELDVEERKKNGDVASQLNTTDVKIETKTCAENEAFEEVTEDKRQDDSVDLDRVEELSDLSDLHSKSSEHMKSDDAMSDDHHRQDEKPPTSEPTIIYKNDLTEEELDAYDDVVFQGEWRRPVALRCLLEIGLIDKETADEIVNDVNEAKKRMHEDDKIEEDEIPQKLRRFLCGEEPVAGILVMDSGEKRSIFKSAKDGILRRGTAISLLEAQAATGNIIDPVTGRKMSVKEATQLGLLDKVYETVLFRAERAVVGYKFRASEHILSVYEAMQKGLVVESHGLRLLEAQCATGGIIDHRINIRVPLDVAVQRGLLDEKLKEKLEDDEGEETKTFFDPNTEENVTYKELMKRSVVDNDTGLRLYPLERIVTKKRIGYTSYSGRSSQASSRTVSRSNSRENLHAPFVSP